MNRDKWLDAAIAALTLAAIIAQLVARDAHARAAAITVKQHAVYYARKVTRTWRMYNEPAWRTELRDYTDGETVQVP